jgi:hypothetical protein
MSLETDSSSAESSESVSSESSSESSSGYSVVDPGYDSGGSDSDVTLESLKDENTPSKSDDAGSDTEETTNKSSESADKDFSDELLDRATDLGYTLNDIKNFRSESELAKEVKLAERLHQRLSERQGRQQGSEQPAQYAPPQEPEPDWAEMIEAGHDPDVIGLQQQMWQRATRAEAMVQHVFQVDEQRAWSAQCERFDESLNKLEEYQDILGSGRRGELLKNSPDLASNRDKVFEKMLVLRNGYQQSGREMPSEAELINEAVQASFWKQTKTIARKELTGQIKKAGSQALSRPHSAGSKGLSGQALAMAKEQAFWKDHS